MKLKRFDIEDNSWSHDIKEHIEGLLKMIPTDDLEIDVAKVIYDGLVHFVWNSNWYSYRSLATIGVLSVVVISTLLSNIYPEQQSYFVFL